MLSCWRSVTKGCQQYLSSRPGALTPGHPACVSHKNAFPPTLATHLGTEPRTSCPRLELPLSIGVGHLVPA